MIIRNRTTWLSFFIPAGMTRSVEDAIVHANSASCKDAPPVQQVASLQDAGSKGGIRYSTERQSLTGLNTDTKRHFVKLGGTIADNQM